MPKISVLMPAYNTSSYIEEAIQSILEQSFKDYEFLICDDGSTDNTLEIISSFKDPRIKILKNKSNQGIPKSRNKLLRIAQGRYLAWLDADDIAYPNRLEEQFSFLESHPDVFLFSGWKKYIDEKSNELPEELYKPASYKADDIGGHLLFACAVRMPTVMMKNTGEFLFDEGYPLSGDYELWTRISRKYKIAIKEEYLIKYRLHKNNVSTDRTKARFYAEKIFKNNLKYYGLDINGNWSLYTDIFHCEHNFQDIFKIKEKLRFLSRYYKAYKAKGGPNHSRSTRVFAHFFESLCMEQFFKTIDILNLTLFFYPGAKIQGSFLCLASYL